jgi:hypothetical protein
MKNRNEEKKLRKEKRREEKSDSCVPHKKLRGLRALQAIAILFFVHAQKTADRCQKSLRKMVRVRVRVRAENIR